ncbi:MAG TPA: dihydropteroate synthase [Dehalococcoidia bacterium]
MGGQTRGSLQIGSRVLDWGSRTYLMGVINVSPESFSGDGLKAPATALKQARRFADEGADILDVGGQSTRPGFDEISVAEEIRRVVPAIERIAGGVDLPVSVDTYRAEVAKAALDAGASMINDIWGFRHDPALAVLCARRDVPAVVMHNQRGREFDDVIGDITAGLGECIKIASRAGVAKESLILDPGFGFGWTPEQNLEMLRRLAELRALGRPLLIGTSRKSTIGMVLDKPEDQRLFGTAASVALAIANGADIVRVHDVAQMSEVARMTDAIVRGWHKADSQPAGSGPETRQGSRG